MDGSGFHPVDPRTGQVVGLELAVDDAAGVAVTVAMAEAAFDVSRVTDPETRARVFETVAEAPDSRRAEIVPVAVLLSGLP